MRTDLTATQSAILGLLPADAAAALDDAAALTPYEVARLLDPTHPNAGGAARSLRTLMARGLVRQRREGWYSRRKWPRYVYWRAEPPEVTQCP